MCDCYSYNWDIGNEKGKILTTLDGNKILIDNCIAEIIQALWNKELWTEGSCCGHGRAKPSLLISHCGDIKDYKNFISGVDNRDWTFSQWQRKDNL